MSEHPTLVEQLVDIPQVEKGVWDMCARERSLGKALHAALYWYPSRRFPVNVSWSAEIQMKDGGVRHFGGYYRRWPEDNQLICLRFKLDRLNVDMHWNNNLSIVPIGQGVR